MVAWHVLENSKSENQRVRVRRAHLEEDTAKLSHLASMPWWITNRAGVPLLEIVSEPDMHTVEAASRLCHQDPGHPALSGRKFRDMEKGVLRFEANVSSARRQSGTPHAH